MARDWDSWLQTASGPASSTEEGERDRTEKRISDAIRAAEDLPPSLHVYAKGSYANNTNVRRDADVDVAVEWTNTFKVHLQDDAVGKTPEQLGYTPAQEPVSPQEFRRRVEHALIDAFGAGTVDTSPNKCIGVAAGSTTLDADVVPCFQHRRYHAPGVFYEGHRIFPKNGGSPVDNFPHQNYDNGVAKNNSTRHRYKEIVRGLKRLVGELHDEGMIPRDYPGYLIESLAYNVPNDRFGYTRRYDDLLAVLAMLREGLKYDSVYLKWTEPSSLLWLFRYRSDRVPANAFNIIDKAWEMVSP